MRHDAIDQQPEFGLVEITADPEPAADPSARQHDERGMTTAEYAVGTIATVSFAGILIGVLTNPQVLELLLKLILFLLRMFWPGALA